MKLFLAVLNIGLCIINLMVGHKLNLWVSGYAAAVGVILTAQWLTE